MNRCFALVLLAFGLGVLAIDSHGQAYKPCFDDPVFEEASFATIEFEKAQIETSKMVPAQIEQPKLEKAVMERTIIQTPEMIKPQIIRPEFDTACQKSGTAPTAGLPRIVWVSSYQPRKIPLMQPLNRPANTHLVASKTIR